MDFNGYISSVRSSFRICSNSICLLPEAGAWLSALPKSSLGLHMENEVVRIAVGLRLGASLCNPHQCIHCQAEVDQVGAHGLACRYSKGCHACHSSINNIVKRSLDSIETPSYLESNGIY